MHSYATNLVHACTGHTHPHSLTHLHTPTHTPTTHAPIHTPMHSHTQTHTYDRVLNISNKPWIDMPIIVI